MRGESGTTEVGATAGQDIETRRAEESAEGDAEIVDSETLPARSVADGHDAAPSEVGDETIAEVARSIRALHDQHALRFAVEVGRLIIERFYGGDLSRAKSRAAKDVSLRKLAEQPDMPLSRSALHNAVRLYDLVQRLGGIETCAPLGPSHLRALLPLPEEEQARLAEAARDKGWTVRELEAAARDARAPKRAGGRPPLPGFVKSLHDLGRYADPAGALLADLDHAEKLDPQKARALLETIDTLSAHLATVRTHLEARAKTAPETPDHP